jgi:hypothetical protein
MDELERAELAAVVKFHLRRLAENKHYDLSLDQLVFARKAPNNKDEKSQAGLLRKRTSYEVLMIIWATSPYAAGLEEWSPDWASAENVFSIARKLAATPAQRHKMNDYVDRVIDAAVVYDLVVRMKSSTGNEIPLHATSLLHLLMTNFALNALNTSQEIAPPEASSKGSANA